MNSDIRFDWTEDEVFQVLTSPWEELKPRAIALHAKYGAKDIQKCVLMSVKTGACPEDCHYCSQSARYQTDLATEKLLPVDRVISAAKQASSEGATRFCMGAAWRDVPPEGDERFDQMLEMIRGVAETGLEVCCTLGMATQSQLDRMREAGLTAYNHNLDTSREFYPQIVTTRSYEDRLKTLRNVRESGVQICSGGIIGMGESARDRAAMIADLASIQPHPESVPINLLVPIKGTPLGEQAPLPIEDFLRVIAAARVTMPSSRVRLSAGRRQMSVAQQMECFEVGANSIFMGNKLLTTPNVLPNQDQKMLSAMAPA